MSRLLTSGSQSIGNSASASVPSNEYLGLISSRIDWFDLAVQRMLKGLIQQHNTKTSILWLSVFFMVQLSYPYMTIGKIIALTMQNYATKVMPLLFNICLDLSQLSLHPCKELVSFNFMAAVTIHSNLQPKEMKSDTVSIFPHIFVIKCWDQMS